MATEAHLLDGLRAADQLLGAAGRAEVEAQLAALERRVSGLREGPMRRAVCAAWLVDLPPAPLVAALVLLLGRARAGGALARVVLQQLALEPVAYAQLDPAVAAEAARLAATAGLGGVGRLLQGELAELDRADEARENPALDLPLGVRRAAARAQDRFALDRLLRDQDWRVISLLLDNPRLTERDVIVVAALRPTRPEVLQVVAQHPRWSTRPAVRKALCCNPHLPLVIARRLLPTLLVQDLRHVQAAGALVPALAREVPALLAARQRQAPTEIDADEVDPGEIDALLAALGAGDEGGGAEEPAVGAAAEGAAAGPSAEGPEGARPAEGAPADPTSELDLP